MSILIGAAGSILAVFILYIMKEFIIPELGRLLFASLPSVAGEYNATTDPPDGNLDSHHIYKLRQIGTTVWGEVEAKLGTGIERYKLRGTVLPTRLIQYSIKPRSQNINDFGVGILRLAFDGKTAEGFLTSMCESCQKPHSIVITLNRKR